ncbi:MAG: hypothetical protein ACTSO7_13810 [Candidatus Heimdallarchaeota archaeon]
MSKNNISAGDIVQALSNEARIAIYFYLQIYKELTLEKLQKLLGKSKTSIHYNIRFMLSLGVIDETTKPGSKTRFYTLNKQRLDESMREAFNDENIRNMNKEEQIEVMQTYMQLSKSLILIIQNVSALMMQHYNKLSSEEVLSEVDDPNDYLADVASKNIQAIYNASEENWRDFVKEFAALINKFYTLEAEHPKRIRPYSFVMVGGNIEDYLQK